MSALKMVDPPERREPSLTPIYCPRCKQRQFEAALLAGSVVLWRCHQAIKVDEFGAMVPPGAPYHKRVTCGYVVRVSPSR